MKVAVNTAKLLRNVPLPDEIATVHDNAIIMDLGSATTRLGFSGDDAPRLCIPSLIGKDKDGTLKFTKQAHSMRDTLTLSHPIERGVVTDWDGMEQLMTHLYNDVLKITPSDANTPVLITEAALVPKEQRENMVELLFDKLEVQSLYFSTAPVLSLYSSGRTTGMVVEMGFGTCHTVPIYEGFGLFHSILQLDFGGMDLSNHVQGMLSKVNVPVDGHHAFEVAQYLKELYCTVLPDKTTYSAAVTDTTDTVSHTLPDGAVVNFGPERYMPCEALFDPSLLGYDNMKGIHHLAMESIRKCDQDIGPTMLSNVVLSGGTSLFKGLSDRLFRELQDLASAEKARVFGSTERQHASWVGGSILASLPTFQDMWVTKAEYEEAGEQVIRRSIAHRNCF